MSRSPGLLPDALVAGGMGDSDSRPYRRKLTLDSSLLSIPPEFDCFFSFVLSSEIALSLPLLAAVLVLGVMVPKSSAPRAGVFLDRVAERILCSKEERMRLNGLDVEDSLGETTVEVEGCLEREDEGCEAREGIAAGRDMLGEETTAAAAINTRIWIRKGVMN